MKHLLSGNTIKREILMLIDTGSFVPEHMVSVSFWNFPNDVEQVAMSITTPWSQNFISFTQADLALSLNDFSIKHLERFVADSVGFPRLS
jgi:hypothetical protein